MSQNEPPHQAKAALISFIAILLGFLFFGYKMIEAYLLSIVMGGILALLAQPALDFLMRKGLGKHKAAALVTVGVITLVIAPLLIFATLAVKQGITIAESFSGSQDFSLAHFISFLTQWKPLAAVLDPVEIEQYIQSALKSAGTNASQVVLNMAKSIQY